MSSWKDRVYEFEQTPPQGNWEKIAAALDESLIGQEFPSRLYQARQDPPQKSWDHIRASLDTAAKPAPQNSSGRFRILRYAAAAVIVGSIGFAILKFSSPGREQSDAERIAEQPRDSSNNTPEKEPMTARITVPTQNDETGVKAISKNTFGGPLSTGVRRGSVIVEDPESVSPSLAYNDGFIPTRDRYIVLMTPNGLIRMSKKLGDVVCCVSGQEQDGECKDQIKKWQEKLACNSATAAGNFFDVLNLVSSLDSEL